MKNKKLIAFLVGCLFLLAFFGGLAAAQALEIRGGGQVVVAADEVIEDDLYAAGQTIQVDGVVKGDLVAFGQTVIINGVVEGDLLASGQSVIITGEVGDDVRTAAGIIQVQSAGRVGDDLVGMGYSLEIQREAAVGGTVLFSGNQALIAGEVGENVQVSADGLSLQGRVGGDVMADVGAQGPPRMNFFMFMPNMPAAPAVPGGLNVEGAQIQGRLRYTAPEPAALPSDIQAEYEPKAATAKPEPTPLDYLLDGLRRFLSIVIVGLLLARLARDPVEAMLALIREQTLKIGLWGALIFVAGFVVFFILVILVAIIVLLLYLLTLNALATASLILGMIAIALYSVGMYVAATWMAQALVGLWLGRLILARVKPESSQNMAGPLILGAFIIAVLLSIPVLGGFAALVVSFFGLGSLFRWRLREHDRKLLLVKA